MRVITFSRQFPAKHPRAGEPTFFAEKIVRSLGLHNQYISEQKHTCLNDFSMALDEPKHHTIRAGSRWKVGDQFSPRIWSGKPYASKQIEIAPPITIVKIWRFEAFSELFLLNGKPFDVTSSDIPENDGLSTDDFLNWFDIHPKKDGTHFIGQILCWNEFIIY